MPVFFDIETLDLFDAPHLAHLPRKAQIKEMRFGLAVTHDSTTSEWRTWHSDDVIALWEYLAAADSVIGWNIIDFDLPVIQASVRRAGRSIKRTEAVTPIDLFAIIRTKTNRWYKLEVGDARGVSVYRRARLSNTVRDIVRTVSRNMPGGGQLTEDEEYGPRRYEPLLPGLSFGLGSVPLVSDWDITRLDVGNLFWTVHCDNADSQSGEFPIVKLRLSESH